MIESVKVNSRKVNSKKRLNVADMKMLDKVKKMPIVYDEDSPKLTNKMLSEFRHYSKVNHKNRTKDTISLRVTKSTKSKLLQLGKGYTSVISRLIEYAFENPALLKKCL